jgi:hypothetical protein
MRQWVSGEEAREVSPSSGQDARVGHPFDDLARSLAEGNLSRRRALRLFGAALVGMMMASVPGMASAEPCPRERRCRRGTCCPEPLVCVEGETCLCPNGREFCPGGTQQGTDTCCPEGYRCCTIQDPEGGGNLASICCPTVGSVCHSEGNVLSCVSV